MHSLDTLFYVRIKLNDLRCEIPPAPLFERGETSLARHFLQLPPFAKGDGGGFSCVGATNIRVMSVYECITLEETYGQNRIPFSPDQASRVDRDFRRGSSCGSGSCECLPLGLLGFKEIQLVTQAEWACSKARKMEYWRTGVMECSRKGMVEECVAVQGARLTVHGSFSFTCAVRRAPCTDFNLL